MGKGKEAYNISNNLKASVYIDWRKGDLLGVKIAVKNGYLG